MSALRVFCAYASQDRAYFKQLKQALAVPMQQQLIAVWHHGEITPGTEFDREIEKQFYQADIVLLLVSPAFMASDYCSTREMQWALRRQKTEEATVIPIIIKPTPDWEATFLGSLQVLPTGKKPIAAWKKRDEAFADVANELLRVVREMQQEERFPVKEYRITSSRGIDKNIQDVKNTWLKEAQCIETHQELRLFGPVVNEKWLLSRETQSCLIELSRSLGASLEIVSITSQHVMFIDHLLQILPLPYDRLQWTLLHDLDVDAVVQKITEQTGKFPSEKSILDYDGTSRLEIGYTFSHPERHGVNVELQKGIYKLKSRTESWGGPLYESITGQIRVISLNTYWDYSERAKSTYQPNLPFREMIGFYHAHQVFSPQKIMAMLNGKFSLKHIWQLIDEAWTS